MLSKIDFLDKLCCPVCAGNLSLSDSNAVCCVNCNDVFPSDDGVLELVPKALRYETKTQEGETAAGGDYSEQQLQRKHFDDWAETYDKFQAQPIWAAFSSRRNWITDSFREGGGEGKYLLDIGCGTGDSAITAAKAGVRVIAFDVSKGVVMQAIKAAKKAGVDDRILFYVGDGGDIPAKDKAFDFAMTMATLHHMPNAKKTCADIQRILVGGGTYIFNENNRSPLRPIFDFMMKIYPLWHEEAGEMPLISEADLRGFLSESVLSRVFYYVYVPPHLVNMLGMRWGKLLLTATDKIFGMIPVVRRWGGIIQGVAHKNPDKTPPQTAG